MAVTPGSFKIEPMDVTWNGTDLGATEGGVEVSFTEDLVDVVADQEGTRVLDAIRSGNSVEVSLTLKEMTVARWSQMFEDAGGGSLTPGGGTEVVGFGKSKNFTAISTQAAALTLKPTGSSDDLRNLLFHKAYPIPESISFVGDATEGMSVSFRVIPDATLADAIELFVFGDGTQTLT